MIAAALHPDYLAYRTKRLYLLICQRIDDELKQHGVGRSQWQVLARVARSGTLTQKDLQQAMQIEAATLTCMVDSLAAKGWLERGESPEDKRVRVLRLTPAGSDHLHLIPDPYRTVETRMLRGMTEQQRADAQSLLEAMIDNLEERS